MKYALNGPLKEYRNKRHTDKIRIKLTETAQIAPTSVHAHNKDKASKQDVTERIFSFEAIV